MQGVETMGFVADHGDRPLLERTLTHYFKQIMRLDVGDFTRVESELRKVEEPDLDAAEVRSLMRSIAYPLGWFYVERAAMILFGVSSQLAPTLNIVQTGFPFVARFLAERAVLRRSAVAASSAAAVPQSVAGTEALATAAE